MFNGRSYGKTQRESPEEPGGGGEEEEYFTEFKIGAIDFLHAIVSVLVFLIFALSDSDVQHCFLPEAGENMKVLMMNLPMGAGVFSSTLFVLFPTRRRGLGYADFPGQNNQILPFFFLLFFPLNDNFIIKRIYNNMSRSDMYLSNNFIFIYNLKNYEFFYTFFTYFKSVLKYKYKPFFFFFFVENRIFY